MRSATAKDKMEDLHFRNVPFSVINELAMKLEPQHSNNWIKLAEKIADYTTEKVLFTESKRGDKTCTQLLFEDYMKKENATVRKVKTALEEMERLDAVEVLNNFMPVIERCHEEEQNRCSTYGRQPEQHSFDWSQVCSQTSSMCTSCCPSRSHIAMAHCQMGICHPLHSPPVAHQGVARSSVNICSRFPSQNGHFYHHPHPYFSGNYHPQAGVVRSDSLEVHNEIGGHQDMSADVEMADASHREEPTPLPQAIMRGGNMLSSFDVSAESMGRPGAINVGREEVVESTGQEVEYVYFNQTTGRGQVGRPGYFQQHSEEMNSKQPTTSQRGGYIIKKIVNNTDPGNGLDLRPVASPPISKLQRLANLPPHYQPDENYKNFVADQKVEDGAKMHAVKEEKMNLPQCAGYNQGDLMDTRKLQSKLKNGMHDKPKTFPRVKASNTVGPVVGDMRGNHYNSLTKSTSMPVDMKPAEFRKAFRYIKVFVTYSNDNKKHLQRVLSLCNCLVKNGFSCCVDINSRYVSTLPNHYDKVNWYKEKFAESDFILVCPSPKYKMEIEAQESSQNAPVPENQLHTRYIYKLMQQEFQSQAKNTRFVPVLFEGMPDNLLPTWLQTSLKYSWPSQFKDLLWMLTRPEDRIKPKGKLFSESTSQSNSPHHEPAF